jgi:hypothetical protein
MNGVRIIGMNAVCPINCNASRVNVELVITCPRAPVPKMSKTTTPACLAPRTNPVHRFAGLAIQTEKYRIVQSEPVIKSDYQIARKFIE